LKTTGLTAHKLLVGANVFSTAFSKAAASRTSKLSAQRNSIYIYIYIYIYIIYVTFLDLMTIIICGEE
jgi:hypothetical protein